MIFGVCGGCGVELGPYVNSVISNNYISNKLTTDTLKFEFYPKITVPKNGYIEVRFP